MHYTLLFRTNTPNASFLFNLTAPGTAILSPASSKKKFFGTGPFMMKKMIPHQREPLLNLDSTMENHHA